jgi:hypothetical protein
MTALDAPDGPKPLLRSIVGLSQEGRSATAHVGIGHVVGGVEVAHVVVGDFANALVAGAFRIVGWRSVGATPGAIVEQIRWGWNGLIRHHPTPTSVFKLRLWDRW